MLGDAASFASRNLGTTDVVEQRGFAVVDVTHHGHNRRTCNSFAFEPQQFRELLFQGVVADQSDLVAQLFSDQLSSFLIQHLIDSHRSAHLEHELDDFRGLDRHLLCQIGDRDSLTDGHVTNDGAARTLEAVRIALLQLGLATTATAETVCIVITATHGTRQWSLGLGSRTWLSLLAITTLVVITACLLGATRLFLLALVNRRNRLDRDFPRRNRCNNRRADPRLHFGLRLATRLFLGTLTRFFFALQAGGLFGGALLFELALLVGLDLIRGTFDEGFLLPNLDTDGLAATHLELGRSLALQGNLARLIHLGAVAALEVRQQGLLFVIGHYLLGAGVRQSCLTHLLQQSLDRCGDHLGQFFHRDLRHASLSSGR